MNNKRSNQKTNHQNILEIRQVIQSYGMLERLSWRNTNFADDMMTFIKSDIIVFGLGVLLFIIANGLF